MTRPVPVRSGTRVMVDGWLATRVLGHWWDAVSGEWSYRIANDRSRKVGVSLFHARAGDFA